MLVLVTAFLLLIGAPAALLVIGRAIVRATDFKAHRAAAIVRAAAADSGEAWYYRRPRPAFRWEDDGEG